MAKIEKFKCPCCDGNLSFTPGAGKITCEYCGSEFDPSIFEELKSDFKEDTSWAEIDHEIWSEEEAAGLGVFHCESCGGELVTDPNTASTFCPYCGSPVVSMGNLSGGVKPKYVIPFKKSEQEAKDALAGYFKGKIFLPSSFKKSIQVKEAQGVYVPYWLFDADVDGRVEFKADKEEKYRRGDDTIIKTHYYKIIREGGVGFDHVPVDASSKMDDAMMESLEPYDYVNDRKEFQSVYLTGFAADKYDVTVEEAQPRATQRVREGTVNKFAETISGYDHCSASNVQLAIKRSSNEYAFFPTWLVNTTWNNKPYLFAVNGETGLVKADLPCSAGKVAMWFFIWLLGLTGIGTGVGALMLGGDQDWTAFFAAMFLGFVIGLVVAIVFTIKNKKKLKGFVKQRGAGAYYRNNSLNLRIKKDIYLYTKTRVIHHSSSSSSSRRRR